jgi:hypothetical protein
MSNSERDRQLQQNLEYMREQRVRLEQEMIERQQVLRQIQQETRRIQDCYWELNHCSTKILLFSASKNLFVGEENSALIGYLWPFFSPSKLGNPKIT